MSKSVLGYKVRNKKTGLYMKSFDKWTKTGKLWLRKCDIFKSINYQIQKLNLNTKNRIIDEAILDWEIVELMESSTSSFLFELDRFGHS